MGHLQNLTSFPLPANLFFRGLKHWMRSGCSCGLVWDDQMQRQNDTTNDNKRTTLFPKIMEVEKST